MNLNLEPLFWLPLASLVEYPRSIPFLHSFYQLFVLPADNANVTTRNVCIHYALIAHIQNKLFIDVVIVLCHFVLRINYINREIY